MRIFKTNKLKWDIRFLIVDAIVILAAIICGIVLYKMNNISNYVYDFANIYIFYVFNFNSGRLFISHILSELLYLYVVFLLAYFTKFKILAYPLLFLRTLFTSLYIVILCSLFGTEGLIVTILVYIPAYLCSVAFFIILREQCKQVCAPYSFICPAVLALLNTIILLLLVNIVFRVIVVIV